MSGTALLDQRIRALGLALASLAAIVVTAIPTLAAAPVGSAELSPVDATPSASAEAVVAFG